MECAPPLPIVTASIDHSKHYLLAQVCLARGDSPLQGARERGQLSRRGGSTNFGSAAGASQVSYPFHSSAH